MKTAHVNATESGKSLWAILLYLIFCFFNLGALVMVHFVYYKILANVGQHFFDFMAVFNNRMVGVCYIPSVVMAVASVYLLLNKPNDVPRWTVLWSVILAAITVIVTLFIIMPTQWALGAAGFNQILYNKLILVSIAGQIVPCLGLLIIALGILNAYFKGTKPVARFIFILLFAAVFYAAGADAVEKFMGYPLWLTIGAKDWVATRNALNASGFVGLYLLPGYLPLLLLIPLFWLRPKGIPKYFIVMMLICLLSIFVITAVYFLPRLQLKLNGAFSKPLIEELIRNDLPLRGIAGLIIYFITAAMFFKGGQNRLERSGS